MSTTPEGKLAASLDGFLRGKNIHVLNTNGTAVAGTPDRAVCIDGSFVYLEYKTPEGRVSMAQKAFMRKATDQGVFCFVVRNKKFLADIVKAFEVEAVEWLLNHTYNFEPVYKEVYYGRNKEYED